MSSAKQEALPVQRQDHEEGAPLTFLLILVPVITSLPFAVTRTAIALHCRQDKRVSQRTVGPARWEVVMNLLLSSQSDGQ